MYKKSLIKPVPIPKKKMPRKKAVVMKDKDEEGEKVGKNWVGGEILHFIILRGKMEFELTKNEKIQSKICLHFLNVFSTLKS